ncbi:MAG TPA: endonuclease/exonuclease/phosphatase family protein [Bacteroidales bacterium]|nr:endonuclease/exonuclease/phosphatase family protein [Bacteroidales bacterium]
MKSFSFLQVSKGIFRVLPVLLGVVSSCTHRQDEIRVMTFNIRLDTPVDSMNNWKYRRENAARMIRFYDADLLGTQEVLHNQLQDLLALLPEYGFTGVGRKDGKTEGEYSALFYRKSRFELLKTGNFWLSQTPEVPGSMGWDAACERMVTWGIFKDRETGKKFAAFNTHFDHKGKLARLNSALLLKERTGQIAGNLPVILTGDFNTTEGSEPIQALLEGGKLKDTRRSAALVYGPEWTFHGFGKVPLPERERIDFIFVSSAIKVNVCASLAEVCDTIYLSDHNPVLAKVVLP